jgi:hypothetical protein
MIAISIGVSIYVFLSIGSAKTFFRTVINTLFIAYISTAGSTGDSSSSCSTFWPQFSQNLTPGFNSLPQLVQNLAILTASLCFYCNASSTVIQESKKRTAPNFHSLFVVHFPLYMLKYFYGASITVGGCPLTR